MNYCFYAKQAVYLVVFNLTDGDLGITKLDFFLRNIKVCKFEYNVRSTHFTQRYMLLVVQWLLLVHIVILSAI